MGDLNRKESDIEVPTKVEIDAFMASNILRGAINDFLGYADSTEEHHFSRLWLFEDTGDDQDPEFVSLHDVCNLLEIDIERIRIGINMCCDYGKKRLRERELDVILETCKIEHFE